MGSGMAPLDETEVAVMQKMIDDTYEDFVGRVATGRGLATEAVDDIAQGRVWAGGDAIGIGLVDEWGGLTDAIQYAATMVGLEKYRVVEFPLVEPMYNQLLSMMNDTGTEQDVRMQDLPETAVRAASWMLDLRGPEIVSRMPYIEINLK
jgi:protease-4